MLKSGNISLMRGLWGEISTKRRRQLVTLLFLMLTTSFAEIVSIGAVLPFLSVLMRPDIVLENSIFQSVITKLHIKKHEDVIFFLTILFCITVVVAGSMRVMLLWATTRLSFSVGSDLSNRIYRTTLQQPYSVHIARNSSEVTSAIWGKVNEVIFYIILPVMNLVSSIIGVAFISVALIFAVPSMALIAIGCLALAYVLIVLASKRRLRCNGNVIAQESSNLMKTLQEGMGGIRDILIDGSQEIYFQKYGSINKALREAQGSNQIIASGPRYLVESLAMLFIAVLAYALSRGAEGVASAIPQMAAIALGLQRLLPSAQQIYNSWSNINGAQASLRDVLVMAEQSLDGNLKNNSSRSLTFTRNIVLNQVSFRYSPQSMWVFENITLCIPKGARVGFVGPTGAGKSTLLDIILGLLHPVEGVLEIDGKTITAENKGDWQSNIAHVPQEIFLSDSSIAENIAFGVLPEEIDFERVHSAARQAQLAEIIDSWPCRYQTRVGERGVQLSGGQRQRIGIARALYKNSSVIVFDEATSALDYETEQAVMRNINELNPEVTVLTIAHRLNTLVNCNKIIEVAKGTVHEFDYYDYLLSSNLKDIPCERQNG